MAAKSQLRIYTISPGGLGEFVERWTTSVRPLRQRFGFRVEGAWTAAEQSRFVWLLSYGGAGTFEEADAAYYASPERAAVRPDPAELIEDAQTFWLRPLEE